ncbi:DUF2971 domain-containing protein [Pseudomonas sp. V1]|uniref:DUF2971 domain-containing protein n=1 Tax=Pseudomonas arcuscaelestis TaxID=2710591 RepID=UPI00193FE190|nr:DUF2971 domain-containing protein [Pseudomonas arcuscaelestis]MBM3105776.1 DUF2971 domain-containing protein [Pseudomonas arcuscaelestis]
MPEEWKDYLKEMLFDRDPAKVDVQAANMFKRRFIPKKLYKYRTITKYALDNLVSDTLHLTTASRFNDPYDSALTVDPYRSKSGREMIERAIASTGIGPIDARLRDRIADYIDEKNGRFRTELQTSLLHLARNGYKLCSLSSRIDSTLMWSHYAKDHTGFAMEYDFKTLPGVDPAYRFLWPIIYTGEMLDISFLFDDFDNGISSVNGLYPVLAAMSKARDWAYEEEWRLIIPGAPEEMPYNLPAPKPTAIYLGAMTKSGNVKRLVNIAKKKEIPVFRMHLASSEYRMEPQQIE